MLILECSLDILFIWSRKFSFVFTFPPLLSVFSIINVLAYMEMLQSFFEHTWLETQKRKVGVYFSVMSNFKFSIFKYKFSFILKSIKTWELIMFYFFTPSMTRRKASFVFLHKKKEMLNTIPQLNHKKIVNFSLMRCKAT